MRNFSTSGVYVSNQIDEISFACFDVNDNLPLTDSTTDYECSAEVWTLKNEAKKTVLNDLVLV